MRYILYFLLGVTVMSASVAFGQKRVVENAIKEAMLVPAKGDTTNGKRPCAIFNKSLRTISVRVEEAVEVNNYLQKRTMVFRNLAPHEKRYVGTSGCDNLLMVETCKSYKISVAYYEDAPPKVMVSAKPGETESGAAATTK